MTRPPIALALAMAALLPASAPAQDYSVLLSARGAGLVGERYDGYLGLPGAVSAAARSSAGIVNIKRRALYSDLAARRGVSPQEVGVTAACQLLARVQVGESYMLADGQWRRRLSGQRAPHPDYCG